MNKTYHLFISHSWAYSDAYEKLIGLLDKDSSFAYTNYSVPKDDPLHTNGTDSELYAAIKEQISHASVVLILAECIHPTANGSIKKSKLRKPSFLRRKKS